MGAASCTCPRRRACRLTPSRGTALPAGRTSLSGLSGGAFTSAFLQLGRNGTDMLDFWRALIASCAKAGDGCRGSLNGHAEEMLEAALPADAAQKGAPACVQTVGAGSEAAGIEDGTQFWPREAPPPRCGCCRAGASARPARRAPAHLRSPAPARLPPLTVNGGLLRVALSQLDASKRTLNGTASWIIDTFFDAVRATVAFQIGMCVLNKLRGGLVDHRHLL